MEETLISHHVVDIGGEAIVICSILHTLLPPWDFLDDFPRAQRYYKVFIYVIGYVALNARSTVYKSVAMKNQPVQPVQSAQTPPPPPPNDGPK